MDTGMEDVKMEIKFYQCFSIALTPLALLESLQLLYSPLIRELALSRGRAIDLLRHLHLLWVWSMRKTQSRDILSSPRLLKQLNPTIGYPRHTRLLIPDQHHHEMLDRSLLVREQPMRCVILYPPTLKQSILTRICNRNTYTRYSMWAIYHSFRRSYY